MPRPKPDIARKAVIVRLEPELLAKIDKARGEVPRSIYIRRALQDEVARDAGIEMTMGDYQRIILAPAAQRQEQQFADDMARALVSIGPVKPKAGSRLKKPKGGK